MYVYRTWHQLSPRRSVADTRGGLFTGRGCSCRGGRDTSITSMTCWCVTLTSSITLSSIEHALCIQPDAMIYDSSFRVCVESRRCLTEMICIICLKRSGNQCNCAPSLTRTRTPSSRHAEPLCNDRLLHASHCIACGPDFWLDVGNAFLSYSSAWMYGLPRQEAQPQRSRLNESIGKIKRRRWP